MANNKGWSAEIGFHLMSQLFIKISDNLKHCHWIMLRIYIVKMFIFLSAACAISQGNSCTYAVLCRWITRHWTGRVITISLLFISRLQKINLFIVSWNSFGMNDSMNCKKAWNDNRRHSRVNSMFFLNKQRNIHCQILFLEIQFHVVTVTYYHGHDWQLCSV